MAAAAAEPKYVCSDGDDCPCHTAEKSRPPVAPITTGPKAVTVTEGQTLYLCACGQSKNFPYCDGTHKAVNAATGSNFAPTVYTATEGKTLYLCMCGHSAKRPFCDGTHKRVHVLV